MADSKLTALTANTTVVGTDLLYLVDIGGTTSQKATVGDVLSASATGNLTAGTSVIWASGTAGKWTGVVTAGNLQAGTAVIWPSGTATTWTGLTTAGNLTAGTTVTAIGGYFTAGTTRILVGTAPVTAVVSASTWGDILFNNRPAAGSATHWVCTAPGTPGTWLACGSAA